MKAPFFSLALITGLAQLAAATTAGGCHADNCARAVTGTRHGTASVLVAEADCSSFLATTVTASASTVYDTVTVSELPSTQTVLSSTVVLQSTQVATNTLTATVTVATQTNTAYTTVTTQAAFTTQVIATQTIKQTTTIYTGQPIDKRNGRLPELGDVMPRTIVGEAMKRKERLEKKTVGGCVMPSSSSSSAPVGEPSSSTSSAVSTSPIVPSIPVYASPCSSAAAYSSACSCWGITGTTVTVPNPTAVTVTVSATTTPTVTVTSTETSIAYTDVTASTLVTQQVTTTTVYVDDLTTTSTQTVFQTQTVTSVSTVSLPTCTNKVLTVSGSNNGGRNIPRGSGNNNDKTCGFSINCYTQIVPKNSHTSSSTSQQSTLTACAQACGNNNQCNAFSYQPSTRQCIIYINLGGYTLTPNPLYVAGVLANN